MADQFAIGTIVRHKTGGPQMTVVKYDTYSDARKCLCRWFDDKQQVQSHHFIDAELKSDEQS